MMAGSEIVKSWLVEMDSCVDNPEAWHIKLGICLHEIQISYSKYSLTKKKHASYTVYISLETARVDVK